MKKIGRRSFLQKSAITTATLPFASPIFSSNKEAESQPYISVFSKHLQFLDYQRMAQVASQIGFDGVELTVRPYGHVEPEAVEVALPQAVEAMKKAGVDPLMMVTAVTDPQDPITQKVLKTAALYGFRYYRMGYFKYTKDGSIPNDIKRFKQMANSFGKLNEQLDLVGSYQNHAGNYVGASMFELYEILSNANSEFTGIQYDIRHATVEGGKSWETGLRLVKDRIKTLALKDFRWEKQNGIWNTINTPMGKGMVDFKKYFSLLKQYHIDVPMSIHFEYDLGGAEHGDRELSITHDQVFEAMQRDLSFIKKAWSEA